MQNHVLKEDCEMEPNGLLVTSESSRISYLTSWHVMARHGTSTAARSVASSRAKIPTTLKHRLQRSPIRRTLHDFTVAPCSTNSPGLVYACFVWELSHASCFLTTGLGGSSRSLKSGEGEYLPDQDLDIEDIEKMDVIPVPNDIRSKHA